MPDPGAARGAVRSAAQVDRAAEAGVRAAGQAGRVRRDWPRPVAEERRSDRRGERVHPRARAPPTMRTVSGRKMRICIVGAGAVGGLIGAWFARAGHEVCLVARGAHLEALRRDGLTLLSNGNRSVFPIPASYDPADFGTQDAVFVCLKTHSIAAMLPRLKPLVGTETTVVPAINGLPWWYFFKEGGRLDGRPIDCLDPRRELLAALDPKRILGCVVHASAEVTEPGVVSHNAGGTFIIGEPDRTKSARAGRLAAAMNAAGFEARVAEAMRVAQAYGMRVPMTVDERIEVARKLGAAKISMHQDVEKRRPLETDAIIGAVVELARKAGIATASLSFSAARSRAALSAISAESSTTCHDSRTARYRLASASSPARSGPVSTSASVMVVTAKEISPRACRSNNGRNLGPSFGCPSRW